MEELCESDLENKVGGCESVCQERVKQVFGQNDIFDMWYYHVRKPDCKLLCQGGLSMDDLTLDELEDKHSVEITGSTVESASYDAELGGLETPCYIMSSLTDGCGAWLYDSL